MISLHHACVLRLPGRSPFSLDPRMASFHFTGDGVLQGGDDRKAASAARVDDSVHEEASGVDSPIVLRLFRVLVTQVSLAEGVPVPMLMSRRVSEREPSKASSDSEDKTPTDGAPPLVPGG